jgi:DNA-directed RNA polymerase alpha subunit
MKSNHRSGADKFVLRVLSGKKIFDFDDEDHVDEVGFSAAVEFILHRADIKTVGQLKRMSDSELLQIPGIGPGRLKKIRKLIP